jgi:thiol-disulfide isomerase/thioredoxin
MAMKVAWRWCALFAALMPSLCGAQQEADAQFQQLHAINPDAHTGIELYFGMAKKLGEHSVEHLVWWEGLRQQYRDKGLEFWRRFPRDPRRFQWLKSTVHTPPFYWRDPAAGAKAHSRGVEGEAVIDMTRKVSWENIYSALRAEFMAAKEVTDKDRSFLRSAELRRDILDTVLSADAGHRNRRGPLVDQLLDFAAHPAIRPDEYWLNTLASTLVDDGIDSDVEEPIVAAMLLSSDETLRQFASGRVQRSHLRRDPLELRLPPLRDGERIDLGNLRGKIVLVDIWSNWCSACVAAMPGVRKVYEKYRHRGFEVVGVWLSAEGANTGGWDSQMLEALAQERAVARKILDKQGVSWPNGVLAGADKEQFMRKYAILGVPVTWLLDRNGMLVTADLRGEKLEAQVRRLLE